MYLHVLKVDNLSILLHLGLFRWVGLSERGLAGGMLTGDIRTWGGSQRDVTAPRLRRWRSGLGTFTGLRKFHRQDGVRLRGHQARAGWPTAGQEGSRVTERGTRCTSRLSVTTRLATERGKQTRSWAGSRQSWWLLLRKLKRQFWLRFTGSPDTHTRWLRGQFER